MGKMRGFSGNELAKRVKKALDETNLGDKRGSEIRALSKGYRQRVGLAQALIHEPPVLILDEPMSGLDPNQAADIRDLIRQLGEERTVILSTHNLAEVEVACKRVLIVARGRIVANATPHELWTRAGKSAFLATLASPEGGDAAAKAKFESFASSVREHAGDKPGELVLEIAPKGDEDLRAAIFRCAVDNGYTLLGLEKRAADLESIFRELTTSAASSAETK
jgi:ABC-2 type transport system ATP-binding protein